MFISIWLCEPIECAPVMFQSEENISDCNRLPMGVFCVSDDVPVQRVVEMFSIPL